MFLISLIQYNHPICFITTETIFLRRGFIMNITSPVEFFKTLPPKQCPECGQVIEEQAESYLMECDHCLSKKTE